MVIGDPCAGSTADCIYNVLCGEHLCNGAPVCDLPYQIWIYVLRQCGSCLRVDYKEVCGEWLIRYNIDRSQSGGSAVAFVL